MVGSWGGEITGIMGPPGEGGGYLRGPGYTAIGGPGFYLLGPGSNYHIWTNCNNLSVILVAISSEKMEIKLRN